MGAEYAVELFSSDATFGPSIKLAEIWDARNLGWSAFDRLPGKGFMTLTQTSPFLSLLTPLTTHVKVWRLTPSSTKNVYSGVFVDFDASGDDLVCDFFDYKALLAISRSGYQVFYRRQTLKQIIDAEWALAKNATSSPLGFITTGTTETPLGTDAVTEIKTSNEFGLLDQMRLQLFYDLSEMGRANTVNQVTYDISRESPHTFTFSKNKGSDIGLGLVLNGNVSDYRHLPRWTAYRNDLATIGQTVGGGVAEVIAKDATAAAAKGLRQDVFTIKTLLGIVGATTEEDPQTAVAERQLKIALQRVPILSLSLVPGALDPFDGWDLCDKPTVELSNGIDSIAARWRLAGVQATVDEAGENLSVITEPILTA